MNRELREVVEELISAGLDGTIFDFRKAVRKARKVLDRPAEAEVERPARHQVPGALPEPEDLPSPVPVSLPKVRVTLRMCKCKHARAHHLQMEGACSKCDCTTYRGSRPAGFAGSSSTSG